jgi:hypothetical protein
MMDVAGLMGVEEGVPVVAYIRLILYVSEVHPLRTEGLGGCC